MNIFKLLYDRNVLRKQIYEQLRAVVSLILLTGRNSEEKAVEIVIKMIRRHGVTEVARALVMLSNMEPIEYNIAEEIVMSALHKVQCERNERAWQTIWIE